MIKICDAKSPNVQGVTHAGVFHADEVFASVILAKRNGGVFNLARVQKVPEYLPENAIVFDIGYGKFDHHQTGGNGIRENGVPYASCGLIWKEYGLSLLGEAPNSQYAWELVDRQLIQGIDAIDCGKAIRSNSEASAMTISRSISLFNPRWDSQESFDDAFVNAFNFATTLFEQVLIDAVSQAKACLAIAEAVAKTTEKFLVLENYIEYHDAIFQCSHPHAKDILYVVYPNIRGGYCLQTVPKFQQSRSPRDTLPASWRGLSNAELAKVCGVPTATFCHKAGFLASASTLDGAIQMAKKAISHK